MNLYLLAIIQDLTNILHRNIQRPLLFIDLEFNINKKIFLKFTFSVCQK
jgi:hypothetical protein